MSANQQCKYDDSRLSSMVSPAEARYQLPRRVVNETRRFHDPDETTAIFICRRHRGPVVMDLVDWLSMVVA